MRDLEQFVILAERFRSLGQLLSDVALEPPADSVEDVMSVDPSDDERLVLSTVHSAKGLEWHAVFVIWMVDGRFPSYHNVHDAEEIEEERRLLYVAMTRARATLDLVAPLRYYLTQQSRTGDRHVYGARSRFLTREVLACLDEVAWAEERPPMEAGSGGAPVDVAARLRGMWA